MDFLTRYLLKSSFLIAMINTACGIGELTNITRGPTYEHPVRTSDLMCYECFNKDNNVKSDECITMANTSKIMVLRCREKETFCKVRRFETKGKLTTFDRKCAEDCTPGCSQDIIHEECVSCCKTSFCNTDNGAQDSRPWAATAATLWLVPVAVVTRWTHQ